MAQAAGIASARSPPTASALARQSSGRSRLPPAVTLYRIASATTLGQSGGEGSARASAASISAWRAVRYSLRSIGPQVRRRRLQLSALVEDFDPPLGFFETRVAEAREVDAALVQLERLLERKVALLEFLHDSLELGDRGLRSEEHTSELQH